METILFDLKGKESGKVSLPGVFETKVSEGLLHEVVTGILANQRSGTHSTKTRGEVRGGGIKPWKQKGTGRARSGSIRSPLWRKGGIIFGPRPKSYYQNLPEQKRKKALQMALSVKFAGGDFIVIEDVLIDEPKTKKVAEILKNLKIYSSNTLLLLKSPDQKLKRASRNIEGLVIAEARSINAYQVLWARKILCTKSALEELKNK